MLKKNKELLITELERAELQEDLTIKVDMNRGGYIGTKNYLDFRTFCNEIIRKIGIG